MFSPGDEVICIRDDWDPCRLLPPCAPVKRQTYIVATCKPSRRMPGKMMLGLKGIPRFIWHAANFRKVQRRHDLDVFKKMLDCPTPTRELENA